MSFEFTNNRQMFEGTSSATGVITATGTTIGQLVDLSQREQVSFQFLASGISSGNGAFTIEVSNDNTNWVNYYRLVDAGTTSGALSRAPTISSNISKIYNFSTGDHFRSARASVFVTTDGSYSVILQSG